MYLCKAKRFFVQGAHFDLEVARSVLELISTDSIGQLLSRFQQKGAYEQLCAVLSQEEQDLLFTLIAQQKREFDLQVDLARVIDLTKNKMFALQDAHKALKDDAKAGRSLVGLLNGLQSMWQEEETGTFDFEGGLIAVACHLQRKGHVASVSLLKEQLAAHERYQEISKELRRLMSFLSGRNARFEQSKFDLDTINHEILTLAALLRLRLESELADAECFEYMPLSVSLQYVRSGLLFDDASISQREVTKNYLAILDEECSSLCNHVGTIQQACESRRAMIAELYEATMSTLLEHFNVQDYPLPPSLPPVHRSQHIEALLAPVPPITVKDLSSDVTALTNALSWLDVLD